MSSTITASLAAADLFTVDGLVAVVTGGATGMSVGIVRMTDLVDQNLNRNWSDDRQGP